jgi:Type II CAAX prenyl endopeptidase Rce1-like
LSQRDLPIWSRVVAAILLLVAGWWAAHSSRLVAVIGDSVVEISAGVVSLSLLLGMRLPLDLWPRAPVRERFSIGLCVAVAVVLGTMLMLSKPTGLPTEFGHYGKAALPIVVLGGTVWALAWGRTNQLAFGRWYGTAAAAAVGPWITSLLVLLVMGRLAPVSVAIFLGSFLFFFVVTTTGSLITQELAFRRVLVGQSGDSGLLIMLAAAVIFGMWNAVLPQGGSVWPVIATTTVNGCVMGALYILSRSLLVSSLYHGLNSGLVRGWQIAMIESTGATKQAPLWIPMAVATTVVAIALAVRVNRRTGLLGAVHINRTVIDAVGD